MLAQDRHIDQWNIGESLGKQPLHLGSIDFQQRCQHNSLGERIVLKGGAVVNGYPCAKRRTQILT